jgi:hypothetical protein
MTRAYVRQMAICSVATCDRQTMAKGLCATHYSRQQRNKPLDVPLRLFRQGCLVHGCTLKHFGNGLCHLHYYRKRRGTRLELPKFTPTIGCSFEYCDKPHIAHGLCREHNRVFQAYGERGLALRKLTACEACGAEGDQPLRLDHDHDSDELRGALCNTCNVALGMVHDDPRRLRALADYIEDRA